jgi:cell wall-associated NlpC family hydrolase
MTPNEQTRSFLVSLMHSLLSVPYLWGGKNKATGLDCSGAVSWCLEQAGIVPGGWAKTHNAENIRDWCQRIPPAEVGPGDLVFYGHDGEVHHVMMVVDFAHGDCLGAAGGGPRVTSVQIALDEGACVKKKRVDYRADIVGYGRVPLQATAG